MSNPKQPHTAGISSYNPYDLLRIYTYYRTLLGSVLLFMFQLEFSPKILGANDPQLFFYTSLIYTSINFLALLLMWRLKFNPSGRNLFVYLLIDVIAITLLMHASGGPLSGLGYLLLIAIAAGGIMLRERIATLLAAASTIAVITQGVYSYLLLNTENKSLFASAALGALTFFTSLIFQYLTRKIRLSHQEALAQAAHAAHLQRLAQQIIERMRTGIVVLDSNQQIELMNQSACALLGLSSQGNKPAHLREIPDLLDRYRAWQDQQIAPTQSHKPNLSGASIKANFAHLEPGNLSETLVFVEDIRALHQQAQQLKLASLGRLTASIAHEVRNPLGAISHASQLLGESSDLAAADKRLLTIIDAHSKRVNQIIENILQLSRRRPATPQRLDLCEWIPAFIKDYLSTKEASKKLQIEFATPEPGDRKSDFDSLDDESPCSISAKFDPSQLQQVLTNLCDNGIRYGKPMEGRADLRIEIGKDQEHHLAFIRVIDFGPGVSAETTKHLFEPFFTTENTGSGLGLYICKELCEANQAIISYKHTDQGESCFQIQLAHPERAL